MVAYEKIPVAIVTQEEVLAPFFECSEKDLISLKRMGVIDDDKLYEISIDLLSTTFACNFYDRISEFYSNSKVQVRDILTGASALWESQDHIGLYYYVILHCGLMGYCIPRDFLLITRRKDAFTEYLRVFAQELEKILEEGLATSFA